MRNVALAVAGMLVALGCGQNLGEGTCERYWVADEVEVPEGTPNATPRVRGGTGDLQLRLASGSTVWCTSHNCRPWQQSDDDAIDSTPVDEQSRPSSAAPPMQPDQSAPPFSDGDAPPQTGTRHPFLSRLPSPSRPPPPPQTAPMEGARCSPPCTCRSPYSCRSPYCVARPTVTDSDPLATAEQAVIDAVRLERQTKHERMRHLLRWLTATQCSGKQICLADKLNVSPSWLSQYMNEKNSKGNRLDILELNKRFSSISHALRRADFPTELPTAEEVSAVSNAAAADAAATDAAAASKSAANPVSTAAPKAAVLSVNLADVAGWSAGGHCHIMALGVPVLGDRRWEVPCPGSSDGSVLQLRVGLRGRRRISAKSHASVAGRVFEWWIEVIACEPSHFLAVHSVLRCGLVVGGVS